jgi:hypothetical protein
LLGECEKITQTLSDIADLPVHSIYARYLRKHIYDPILARCERVLDPKTADQSTELLTNNTNLLLKALDDGVTRLETLSEHAIIRERVTELGEQIDDVRMELDDYLLDGSDELCEEFNNYSNSDNHETGDNFKGPDERCEMIIKQCQAILLTGLAIVKRSIELLYSSAAATTATADSPSAAESIMDSLERLSGLIDDIGCGCYSWDENDQQIIQDSLDFTKELNSIVKLSTANDDGSSIDGRLERLFATLLPKQIDRLKECYNTI